ncbi:MAG: PEP-CTERM sorting domain-containing protein [Candidatus Korobacteraceae bacterium]
MRTTSFFLLTILCFALSTAFTQSFINTGPINGNLNAFFIDGPGGPFGQSISDGFVANATGNPDIVNFGEWTLGGAPTVVNWSLGTTSFGSDLGSGGGAVTSTFLGTDSFGYGIYNTQLIGALGSLMYGDTYYLTLSGANDAGGSQFDGWDDNESVLASCYFQNPNGSGGCPTTESESFTITGCCGPPVPEPSSILLFGSGILGFAGVFRRKLVR